MKKLFKFKHTKLFIILLMIVLAYFVFSDAKVQVLVDKLGNYSYLGSFIAGIFFSFGFLAPFAVGFFVTLKIESINQIIINAMVGGLGAMIADLAIFRIIKFSFMNEFRRLEKTKSILEINNLFHKGLIHKIRIYLLYVFAGVVIASPLPDEIGVSMLAGLTKIKINNLGIISFILNTIGIIVLIFLGSL